MMMQQHAQISDGAVEERAENARLSSFVGAIAIGDLLKTTLGPKGMDKILVSASDPKRVKVTNDGATILSSIHIGNPAAKILCDISKTQDDDVGDGTSSVCVLTAELLRCAEKLIEKGLHPQVIIQGFRIASQISLSALEQSSKEYSGVNEEERKKVLESMARTALGSKVLSGEGDLFPKIAVEAIMRLGDNPDIGHIQIIKKIGGRLSDSYIDDGFILDKQIGIGQPKVIENAKILIANTPMDMDKIKIFGAKVKVEGIEELAAIEAVEKEKMKQKVEKIKSHNINCFINRQLVYNYPEQLFADLGIVCIEHADFEGVERLAFLTGGEIASTFDTPEITKLGSCNKIEEILIGDQKLIKFSGVKVGRACTIILRGSMESLLDEAERSLHDALCVLSQTAKEPRVVFGGGCSEILMAKAVEEHAKTIETKISHVLIEFSNALRQLPAAIADNGGYSGSEIIARLNAAHNKGENRSGIDLSCGGIANMETLGVLEPLCLKRQVLTSATEAAEMILRVDDIITCAPRERTEARPS